MPLKIGKSDRRFLLFAGAVLLPLIAAVALLSDEDEESNVPSTYSAQTQGAKAAYLLLEEQGYKVERWTRPPTQLPADAAGTVYVLAGPWGAPSREEKNALQNYLTHGGKILATSYSSTFLLPQASIEYEPAPKPEWKEYPPQLLTGLTRGGPITMSPAAYWKTTATNVFVHYADNKRPIVVSYKVGNGEVIWWARATPLTNLGITAKGNLALFLSSVGGKDVRVLWDEYYHGERDTLDEYFHEPPLKYGFLQCLLLAMALIVTYSRRNSPIYPPDSAPRLSPLEFVHTLGGLYRRAHATRSALEIPYNRFRMLAARQLGLKQDVEAAVLARALRNRTRSKDKGLEELLNEIETTLRHGDPKEDRVLKLLQELNRHMQDLKLIGKPE